MAGLEQLHCLSIGRYLDKVPHLETIVTEGGVVKHAGRTGDGERWESVLKLFRAGWSRDLLEHCRVQSPPERGRKRWRGRGRKEERERGREGERERGREGERERAMHGSRQREGVRTGGREGGREGQMEVDRGKEGGSEGWRGEGRGGEGRGGEGKREGQRWPGR